MGMSVLTMDIKTLLYSELQMGTVRNKLGLSTNKQETEKVISSGIEMLKYWLNARTPYISENLRVACSVVVNVSGQDVRAYDILTNPQMYNTNVIENALMLTYTGVRKLVIRVKKALKLIEQALRQYMREYERTNGVIVGDIVYSKIYKTLNEIPREEQELFEIPNLMEVLYYEIKTKVNDNTRQMQIHNIMQNLYNFIQVV